jgi:hypothetical protein
MVILLLAAGALLGAAAGGTVGYLTAGLAGATLGIGAGALAGLGSCAAAYALTRRVYWYPVPYPGYGYWCHPAFYPRPRLYYTTAY